MKFDPNNPLTEAEINNLNDNDLFIYLDDKSKYLKEFSKPLDTKYIKKFLFASIKSSSITNDNFKVINKLGRKGDSYGF